MTGGPDMHVHDIVKMYFSALLEMALTAFGGALLAATLFHELAVRINMRIDTAEALFLVWQIIIFLGLWPGQCFWTITRQTHCGRRHSIIGIPTKDDICASNRSLAIARCARRPR